VRNVVNFERSAATIAPLTKPSHEVKHPMATRRVVETPCDVSRPSAVGLSSSVFGLPSSVII
jgi:hypothetical protein